MTDRLDTIRKRLASGSPFGAYGTDLVWALDEIERLTKENERLTRLAYPTLAVGADPTPVLTYYRAEIARLDALSRATADDPEDVVPCVPCGRVECECGDARDEEQCV